MDYKIINNDEKVILEFIGDMILNELMMKKNRIIDEVERSNKNLVIDFSHVEYLDSTGIGLLMNLTGIQKKKGKTFDMINMSDRLKKIMELSSITDIL